MTWLICIIAWEGALVELCQQYHKRINALEEQKYDLEYAVKRKDFEVRFYIWCKDSFIRLLVLHAHFILDEFLSLVVERSKVNFLR